MADTNPSSASNGLFGDLFEGIDLTDPIKNVSKEIGEQVSGIKDFTMSEVNVASNFIKDGVALVNGLDSQINKTISAFKSEALGQLNSLLTALTGGLLDSQDLFDLVSLEDGLKLNLDSLYNKISSIVGFDVTNISGFIKSFESRLVNTLNNLTGGYLGLQMTSGGKILRITSDINSTATQNMLSTLDRMNIGDYSNTYNDAVSSSLNNSLLEQAIYTGMVDSYQPLIERNTDKAVADKSLTDGMGIAIQKGDVVSLAELFRLLTPSGSGQLQDTYPNGAADLTQYFSIPSYLGPADYNDLGQSLWDMCVAINGENWWKIYSDVLGEWVPNMLIGSLFSEDVLKVWMDRPEVIPLIACRSRFKEMSAKDRFLDDFPSTPVT